MESEEGGIEGREGGKGGVRGKRQRPRKEDEENEVTANVTKLSNEQTHLSGDTHIPGEAAIVLYLTRSTTALTGRTPQVLSAHACTYLSMNSENRGR